MAIRDGGVAIRGGRGYKRWGVAIRGGAWL